MPSSLNTIYRLHSTVRFPLPSAQQIDVFEAKIGRVLPRSYRSFLLSYNGGYFDEPSFTAPFEDGFSDRLNHLYGIGTQNREDDLVNNIDIFTDNLPVLLLPIGYTMMGNLLIMPFESEDEGQIFLKKAWTQEYLFSASDIDTLFDNIADANGL